MEQNDKDFTSLIETRILLETFAVKLAAQRRTLDDIVSLKNAQSAFVSKTSNYETGIEENLMFHLKIAEASKNQVLKSLLMRIIPDLIYCLEKLHACENGRYLQSVDEHEDILEHIINKEPELAEQAMLANLEDLMSNQKSFY